MMKTSFTIMDNCSVIKCQASVWILLFLAPFSVLGGESVPKKRVAVFLLGQDVFSIPSAYAAEQRIAQRLAAEPGFLVLDAEQVLEQEVDRGAVKLLAQAQAEFSQGVNQYQNLDLDLSIASMARAAQRFERAYAGLGLQRKQYFAALMYQGAAWLNKGELQKGQDSYRRLLVQDPSAQMDRALFPPGLIRTFEAVRRGVREGETGGLEVFSNPSQAKVFVDGNYHCISPCNPSYLPVGKHVVVVRRAGYRAVAKSVTVSSDSRTRVHGNLRELPGSDVLLESMALFATELGPDLELSMGLQSIFADAKLDQVLLGQVVLRGQSVQLRLSLFDVRSASQRGYQTAVLVAPLAGGLTDMVAKLLRGRFMRSVVVDTVGLEPKPAPFRLRGEEKFSSLPSPAYYQRWYFWAGLGSGLAVVATVLWLVLPQDPEPKSQILLEF